ncbi:TPA: helix-turn-helix domain-containing protein [Salmonella enterica subsp. salamae serovar [1],40:z35:e,n,x,z15]|nr:helix-turn-helix domain-containing protein [Salmonella enterica subsp. salamae]ECI4078191.1 DNA-binding protein [Salmonella enterica subsp. salamae]EEO2383072.1 helix-turn-helix domain-containing protein [Salmonella enterica]HCL5346657.1 helix-turn-helix domain-containing protein [Salmonella enterica]HCM1997172.1 helix-turn-helix domain-containing protein [Salmonella enterica subsp. salamae serovar [1],40:z35:e,n,x,z15]
MNTQLVKRERKKLASSFNSNEIIANRVGHIVSSVFADFDDKSLASEILVLEDLDLLVYVVSAYLQKKTRMSEREMDLFKARIQSTVRFYQKLDKLGGTIKAKEVSELLGVTRQTVNNQVNKGKLIALRRGGDYLFPSFQFKGAGMLPHLEEILQCLPQETDAVTRVSFLTRPIPMDDKGTVRTPLDILQKDPSDQELMLLRREANLFARHMAS